jgi:DUF1365 family protein
VRHRRFSPAPHAFRYRLFMLYLDLGELPGLFDGRLLWSARRPAPAWFRRADYLGDSNVALEDAVRSLVADRTGSSPRGPIRLLTHLRYFGYVQNPVSFYYCFDGAGQRVDTIVAEVTNTPWGERHSYVLKCGDGESGRRIKRFCLTKEFHVSPFMPMDLRYDWRFSEPARRLVAHMENHSADCKLFDATLVMRREGISWWSLARALTQHPWMTGRVVSAIYWQALRLYLKRIPFYTHPAKRGS